MSTATSGVTGDSPNQAVSAIPVLAPVSKIREAIVGMVAKPLDVKRVCRAGLFGLLW